MSSILNEIPISEKMVLLIDYLTGREFKTKKQMSKFLNCHEKTIQRKILLIEKMNQNLKVLSLERIILDNKLSGFRIKVDRTKI